MTALDNASRAFMDVARHASTLYDLDSYSEALMSALDSAETPEEQARVLAEIDLTELLVQDKVEAYLAVIESLKWLAEGRKAAAKRMADRAKVPEHAVQRLKERLLEHMQRTGQQRIETQQFSVRRQLNPPSAEIYDEAAVPPEFVEIRTETHIKVRDAIAHFKATGEVIPGMTVSQREGLRLQ